MDVIRELFTNSASGPWMLAMTALLILLPLGAIFTVEDIENDKREAEQNERP